MIVHINSHIIWHLIFSIVCLVAFFWGGKPEKLTVFVLLMANIATIIPLRSGRWRPIEPTLFLIDLGVAAFFIGLALKSSRWWPLWAAAFHLLAVGMLIVNALDPQVRPYAYYVGELIWDYLGLMALLFGALIEGRRDFATPAPFHASSNPSAR